MSVSVEAYLRAPARHPKARCVTEMGCGIIALVLAQPELDANYERVKTDIWEWGQTT